MEKVNLSIEQRRLLADCQAFIDVVNNLSEDQFTRHTQEKWSVAEVMQHLYLSARPVVRLMTGTHDILLQWGKPKAPSRTYGEISSAYQQVLQTRVKAPESFVPRADDMDVEKNIIVDRFVTVYQTLAEAINNWADDELDAYIIPHPVLGKLTVREMIHFTSAHTQHHLRLLPTL